MNQNSKILVTGGTGLVGSHLLVHLVLKGASVRAIYRTSSDLEKVKRVFSYYTKDYKELFSKVNWVEADVTNIPSLESAFSDIKYVFHCAALVSFRKKDDIHMRNVNIKGTANLVNLALANNIEKFCYVSSIATLDKKEGNKIIDETAEWNPENNNYDYAISKYGGEMEVWRGSQEGLAVVIVNPAVILGSGFWTHNTGLFFTNAAKSFSFYTAGKTGFVGVVDVVKAMIQLMDSKIINKNYVLVAENTTYQNVMTKIANALGTDPPTRKVSPFMASIAWRLAWLQSVLTGKPPMITKHSAKAAQQQYSYSSERIQQDLDFKFESLQEIVRRTGKRYLEDYK